MSRSSACRPLLGMNRFALSAVVLAACTGTTNPVLTDLGSDERVWVGGSWAPDTTTDRGGVLEAETALPAVPTDLVLPPVQQLSEFDLTADGSRIAYVTIDTSGDSTVYIANSDGTEPIQLYVTSGTISFISLSPDGAYLAMMGDIQSGTFDLLLLEVANPQNGVTKLNPAETTSANMLGVYPRVAWSATSRYVAFEAALTDPLYWELYVVDLQAGLDPLDRSEILTRAQIEVPAASTSIKGAIAATFDGDDRLWYGAATASSLTPPVELFVVDAGGFGTQTQIALPTRTDDSEASIDNIKISPDGHHIAYSVDAPTATAFQMYYAPTADPTLRVQLTSDIPANMHFTQMAFSPDGGRIALLGGEYFPAVQQNLYVANVAGGSELQLTALPPGVNFIADYTGDYSVLQWSSDAVWFAGQLGSDQLYSLYRFDPAVALQTPERAFDVGTNGGVTEIEIR